MAAPQFSCSTFTDRGTTYFAAVTLHGGPDGGEGSADLAVTDGAEAWTAQGAQLLLAKAREPELRSQAFTGLDRAQTLTMMLSWQACRADVGDAERRAGRPPEAPAGGAV